MTQIRIALVGSHGVGKSTLIAAIQEHFRNSGRLDVLVTPEVPRQICQAAGDPEFFRRENNRPLRQSLILFAQATADRSVGAEYQGLVLSDRSVIDHWAYTIELFSKEYGEAKVIEAFEATVATYCKEYDALFYIGIEFAPKDDGTRESDPQFQANIDATISELLRKHHIGFTTLAGSVEERLASFLATVEPIVAKLVM